MKPMPHGGNIPLNSASRAKDYLKSYEAVPEHATYFEGIYYLRLNCDVSVKFIPYIDKTRGEWPPEEPEGDPEEPGSAETARIWEFLYSRYVVTPSWEQAGQQEKVEWGTGDDLITIQVLYIHPDLFEQLIEELDFVAREKTPGVTGLISLSSLGDTPLARFIKDFANSDCLSPYHKEILASS